MLTFFYKFGIIIVSKGGEIHAKKERSEKKLDYTCYECDTTFKHTFRIERGLTGLKAKGHVQCPNCNYKVYAKIYLDRE